MIFRFKDMYKVNKVEIIYRYFDAGTYYCNNLKLKDNVWQVELSLDKDKIFYKYLVNGTIKLNDGNANKYCLDENREIWSVADLYEGMETDKNISYILNCKIIKGIPKKGMAYKACRTFVHGRDKIISTYVEIKELSGTHSITVIWHQPDGNIYKVEEAPVVIEDTYTRDVEAGFWICTEEIQGDFYDKVWTVSVYLDGRYMTKEYFVINRKIGTEKRVFYKQA